MKIFLNKFFNKRSVNTSEGLNVELKGNRKLLPLNDFAETVNEYEQYMEERGSCNKIRLTCQVNPICSNVLFNKVTEIVKEEGSSSAICLNYTTAKINGTVGKDGEFEWRAVDAIKDTQPSSRGFIYHCGLDIFNNHLLRSKTFKVVCKMEDGETNNNFNTIADMMRNANGWQINESITYPQNANVVPNPKNVDLHLYEYDDIYSYKDAINAKLMKNFNGWFGFENTSKIKSYLNFMENEDMRIEKPLSYMSSSDFIDMYPGRDLYSFIPKYNPYRRRIEKNWNYCLTYPSSSLTEGFDDIMNHQINGLRAMYFDENTLSDNGSRQLVVYGITKHGLSVGDFVNIYCEDETSDNELVLSSVEVKDIVDDYIFTVFSDIQISNNWVNLDEFDSSGNYIVSRDVAYIHEKNSNIVTMSGTDKVYYVINDFVNLDDSAQNLSYKKVVNGVECDYYVRLFSRLPNFKFASGDTSSEVNLYKDDASLIKEYQKREYEFENHISRLGFANNVYGDGIGEIVFTDDIDVSNLKDNLGRPLSSIFITFVKNNKGYEKWYGVKGEPINIVDEGVEYSHCFGPVTCGIETSDESFYDNSLPNIHTMNANVSGYGEVVYDDAVDFYGDLCYYDTYNAIERSIQPFLHRFNTAQREFRTSYYDSITYDEIVSDDYDYNSNWELRTNTTSDFYTQEGYYYNPHYEIRVNTFDKVQTAMPDFLTILEMSYTNGEMDISCFENHYLTVGDKAVLFDWTESKYYQLVALENENSNYKRFFSAVYDDNGKPISDFTVDPTHDYRLFKVDNLDIPSYAKIMKDGTCRLVWRNLVVNGMKKDDSTLEEYPFTNGAFYVNKRIDIYVRRQDPYGMWGLYDSNIYGDELGVYSDEENENIYFKESEMKC